VLRVTLHDAIVGEAFAYAQGLVTNLFWEDGEEMIAGALGRRAGGDGPAPGPSFVRVELEDRDGKLRRAAGGSPFQLELLVDVLRPRTPSEAAAAPARSPGAGVEPGAAGSPARVEGSGSLNGAPRLAAGSYADVLRLGETSYYRARVSPGERLVVRGDAPEGASVELGVLSALRGSGPLGSHHRAVLTPRGGRVRGRVFTPAGDRLEPAPGPRPRRACPTVRAWIRARGPCRCSSPSWSSA
jgi:hypothetical protein